MTAYRKKLIEVAMPLDAINKASVREKSIRHGHPSTLHRWWARKPLTTCRAVLFGQLVDDPPAWPDLFPHKRVRIAFPPAWRSDQLKKAANAAFVIGSDKLHKNLMPDVITTSSGYMLHRPNEWR